MARKTFEDLWREQFEFNKDRHRQKENRRIAALERGEKAVYGYWNESDSDTLIDEEYINDIPNLKLGAIFELEYSYQQTNEIILEGGKIVNLIYVCKYGRMYTEFNALKLPIGHVLRDLNGVKVQRQQNGLFERKRANLMDWIKF